jgi:hypothetical protein
MSSRTRVLATVVLVAAIASFGATFTRAAGNEPAATQLLRNTERAKIIHAVVGHEPMALGSTVRLAVEVEMLPGMHVNANPPTHDWLIPVEVSITGADGVGVIESFYPEAESRKFPYDDEPYLVYEGTFVVGLILAVDADIPAGGRELEVVLGYQACDDTACYAPTDTSVKLPIMIVADASDAVEVRSRVLDRAPFPR